MTRQTRIMLVTDAVGGVWTYSVELAEALRGHGFESLLAVIGPSPSAAQRREAGAAEVIDTGLPLDWTAGRPDLVRRAGCALAELATSKSVDLVQTNTAALLADCTFDQPVVVLQHSCVATWWDAVRGTALPRDFLWRRDLVEMGMHAAKAVVAPTAAFAAQTSRVYSLGRPIQVVHNGRRALPMRKRGPENIVFTAGRLWDEGKNVQVLDEAAALLKVPFEAAGPLAGPNGTAVSFDHLVTPGQLSPDQLAERLGARPIFASAARYEPFGLSVLEAAQAGSALVLSDIPTFRELWGGCALFVPADDPHAFVQAIEGLIEDPELRAAMSMASRTRALRYTSDAMATRMVQLYAGILPQPALPISASTSAELAGAA